MLSNATIASSPSLNKKRRRLQLKPNHHSYTRDRMSTAGNTDEDLYYGDDENEVFPVNGVYSNDCYDDIWYGKSSSCTMYEDVRECDMDDYDDVTRRTMTMDEEHHDLPLSQSVRSSWFNKVRWISSSDWNYATSNSSNVTNHHLILQQSQHNDITNSSQQRMYPTEDTHMKDDIVDGSNPLVTQSNHIIDDHRNNNDNFYPTSNTGSIRNDHDDTIRPTSVRFMIQHLRQQLVQVKCRFQPAIERYNDKNCNTSITAVQRNTSKSTRRVKHQYHTKSNIFDIARRECNPYEVLGERQGHGLNQYLFMNRSAIKLVNIDAILDFILTNITTTTTTSNVFKFCDLCGAPGGFSEYILWRTHQNNHTYCNDMNKCHGNKNRHPDQSTTRITSCRGYGMSLMGHNEHGCGLPWKLHDTSRNTRSIDASSYKICYGVDGTGDIYNWDNVIALQDMIYNDDVANINNYDGEGASHHQEYGKVHLVVVDGGFDAQRNTEYQEEVSLKLVVNETAAALSMLCTGGTFVIKLFGFQTSIVRTMMTHLYMMFHRIIALKPISSRPASAERYVVCYGYHGHPPNWSGQHWCNDLYMSRPCTVLNLPSSDINYIDKEVQLLRYLDEFDRDMYMLNLKASFAILSYIERKYLQQVICMNEGENSDGSDVDVDDPHDLVEDDDVSDEAFRVNIPMYRKAWRLER